MWCGSCRRCNAVGPCIHMVMGATGRDRAAQERCTISCGNILLPRAGTSFSDMAYKKPYTAATHADP